MKCLIKLLLNNTEILVNENNNYPEMGIADDDLNLLIKRARRTVALAVDAELVLFHGVRQQPQKANEEGSEATMVFYFTTHYVKSIKVEGFKLLPVKQFINIHGMC